MNPADIEEAFAAGRIDRRFRHELLEQLVYVRRSASARSPVGDVMARVQVVQTGNTSGVSTEVLTALRNLPGAQHRPGMVELFRTLHREAMCNVADGAELEKLDTPSQVESIVRVEVQAASANAIREIWQPMKTWFDRQLLVIPPNRRQLKSPEHAETVANGDPPLAMLPLSSEFAGMFSATTVEQTLALLKRAIEAMGRHFTFAWAASPAARKREVRDAMKLMRTLRNLDLRKSICNGFASGASDVINPLHNLMSRMLEVHGPQVLTEPLRRSICQRHEEFSVFLATFSLDCLAMLEHVLRVPAASETVMFLDDWTRNWPDFHGKGCPLDCLYDRKYFRVHDLEEESGTFVPIVDFNIDAFSPAEVELMSSRKIRLGCPSLGGVHRAFTRAMCDAYFGVVWPHVVRQYEAS